MSRREIFIVESSHDEGRLDATLARRVPELSRAVLRRLIESGLVAVNGSTVKPSHRLKRGDQIIVTRQPPASLRAEPEDIDLEVVYQDGDLAVIDKPAGLVVHPAPGHERGTLSNALMARFPHMETGGSTERPGIVHRLDKDTSGLIVIALNSATHRALQKQISERSLDRRYLALVGDQPHPDAATIRAPIGRDIRVRNRMAVFGATARPAETTYVTLKRFAGYTLLEARLHTGRTHQIRVHLASIGHAIAGDTTYGGPTIPGLDRQFLHAYQLSLTLPESGERLTLTSPLPPDLESAMARLQTIIEKAPL
ncbi:MAG TPA: RluA family pseudouridine synthase [Chloroflexota bacterium]